MPSSSKAQESIRATVMNLCGTPPTRYAVTLRVDTGQTVTFALIDPVWDQSSDPVIGEEVKLSQVYRTKRGFRANIARRIPA